MKKISIAMAFMAICQLTLSQINFGGAPARWNDKTLDSEIPFVATATPNYELLELQDAIADQHKDVPYRFGEEFNVNYGLENSGLWSLDPINNEAVWRLGIACDGAKSISLFFDEYEIPKGGELYIWTADREEYLGSFDHRNNKTSGKLATGLLHGSKVVVEYHIPLSYENRGKLTIGQIVHGYRSFLNSRFVEDNEAQRGPFGNSGNCEVNVNCPEGDDWQIEKKSVAIIVEGGYGMCTGALVNNTANDGTPYFLTANHCTQGADVGNWIFYFNHESNLCSGATGPTSQSISGSSLVANLANSDFALLLLDNTPPESFGVHYAGWDATDDENAVQSAVCIHHPSGDIKKISFENDAPYHDTGNGAQVWWIDDWEVGVTEPGSSGSPLFNQDHRIIGQLFGGASGCIGNNGNGLYDFYGRFGESWDFGNTTAKRLREWLDPGNTGVLVLNGYPDGFISASIDPGATSINNVPASICGGSISPSFTLTNYGSTALTSCTILYQLNSENTITIDWTGNLAQSSSTTINLNNLLASNGANTLTVWISNPNGSTDENTLNNQITVNFNAVLGTTYSVSLNLTLDNYPEETSWKLRRIALFYMKVDFYTDAADGETINLDFCLPAGCYDFTIFDTENDGICCFYGLGFYEVVNSENEVLATGGNFDSVESTTICLGSQSVSELSKSILSVYPNPAHESMRIDSKTIIKTLEVMDMTGRVVETFNPNTTSWVLSTMQYPNGTYQVRVITTDSTDSTRFVIRH
jgi:lysyl endopeptidase